VLFRKHTVLPLDDCFYALRATIKFAFAQLTSDRQREDCGQLRRTVGIDAAKFGLGVPIYSVLKV
jgi:hypothetical protein